MLPKISYTIATKNRGFVIKETLDSLLNQSIQEWEAIIIDDHGNDDTKDIIANYKDSRFRYYKLPDDHGMGVSCARNFGVIYAKSNIIAILDSDDLAYPNRSQITIDAFNDNKTDIFYGDIDVWIEKENIVRDRNIELPPYSLEKMKELHFIPHPAVAFKRTVLLNNPYNQFFKLAEDYELLSRLAVNNLKFNYTTKKLTKYRISDYNSSIGDEKTQLAKDYNSLVKMIRGWEPLDQALLDNILKGDHDNI